MLPVGVYSEKEDIASALYSLLCSSFEVKTKSNCKIKSSFRIFETTERAISSGFLSQHGAPDPPRSRNGSVAHS